MKVCGLLDLHRHLALTGCIQVMLPWPGHSCLHSWQNFHKTRAFLRTTLAVRHVMLAVQVKLCVFLPAAVAWDSQVTDRKVVHLTILAVRVPSEALYPNDHLHLLLKQLCHAPSNGLPVSSLKAMLSLLLHRLGLGLHKHDARYQAHHDASQILQAPGHVERHQANDSHRDLVQRAN